MHIIFDFDGTLVDSYQCAIDTLNAMSDQFRYRKVEPQEVDQLKELSSKQLIQFLRIPFYKMPKVLSEAKSRVASHIHYLKPTQELVPLLKKLNAAGYYLDILTSNSVENVESWLEQHQLSSLFCSIHSASSYFGKGKVLKQLMKLGHMDSRQTFYVGDETRDIEAAKSCNVASVAVTWGFNSEMALSNEKPHYLVRSAEELLNVFLPEEQLAS